MVKNMWGLCKNDLLMYTYEWNRITLLATYTALICETNLTYVYNVISNIKTAIDIHMWSMAYWQGDLFTEKRAYTMEIAVNE